VGSKGASQDDGVPQCGHREVVSAGQYCLSAKASKSLVGCQSVHLLLLDDSQILILTFELERHLLQGWFPSSEA
jgi:hypothetical protein